MIPTILCPCCNKPHALFFLVHKRGYSELVYRCNKQEFIRKTRGSSNPEDRGGELRHKTQNIPVPEWFQDCLDPEVIAVIPQQWTPAYAKERALKKQGQLVLMYEKRK